METAYIIGNGESRTIFPIEELKDKGAIWGCNAIYRDRPDLCDHIVAVNPPMYDELKTWHQESNSNIKIYGVDDISKWDYVIEGDQLYDCPKNLKLYRIWRGGDAKKGKAIRTIDFSHHRGSGTSAVLLAAESGVKNVCILAFDILGARQWEYLGARRGELSREQNNIYKNTENYPPRMNMKAYLKYEWLFHLRQIFRKHPDVNFYFFNRREYIEWNYFLKGYFDQPNIKAGTYADLKRFVEGEENKINWWKL